jgi:hypothetical protein
MLSDSLLRDPSRRFDVVWITANLQDSTAAYVARHALAFPVGRFVDRKMPMVMKTRVVPLTVVLDRFGRVEFGHAQAVTDRAVLDSLFRAAYRAAAADSLLSAGNQPPR